MYTVYQLFCLENSIYYNLTYFSRKVCQTCGILRTERVHHCPICNICTPRMDHHCFVLSKLRFFTIYHYNKALSSKTRTQQALPVFYIFTISDRCIHYGNQKMFCLFFIYLITFIVTFNVINFNLMMEYGPKREDSGIFFKLIFLPIQWQVANMGPVREQAFFAAMLWNTFGTCVSSCEQRKRE